ncbi:MAG: hypothetical protein AAGJ53_00325 [Pseudomonadota bacterium]
MRKMLFAAMAALLAGFGGLAAQSGKAEARIIAPATKPDTAGNGVTDVHRRYRRRRYCHRHRGYYHCHGRRRYRPRVYYHRRYRPYRRYYRKRYYGHRRYYRRRPRFGVYLSF